MPEVEGWFTNRVLGHEPYSNPLDDDVSLTVVKEKVAERFPHFLEVPVLDGPMSPFFIFDEKKNPWTSFYSRSEKLLIFAFQDVRDAVEFRLKL